MACQLPELCCEGYLQTNIQTVIHTFIDLVLAQASPIFHSSCEGKLGIALE